MMRLRRRKVEVEFCESLRLMCALGLRGDREGVEAVKTAPRLLDRSDARVSRALTMLAELRDGAPVNPKPTPAGSRPRIAVNLAESEARRRELWAAREAYLRRTEKSASGRSAGPPERLG